MWNQKEDKSEIIWLLLDDHRRLRGYMEKMRDQSLPIEERRRVYNEFLPLLESHTSSEEETLIARSLVEPKLREHATEGLEEHDLTEVITAKLRMAASEEQWEARMKVLCETLEHHLEEEEKDYFPVARKVISETERQELGARYTELRQRYELAPIVELASRTFILQQQAGRIGYLIAWLLGVPAWLLLMIFLIRGH